MLRARADADIERMFAEDDGTDFMMVDGHKVPIRTVHDYTSRALDMWQQSAARQSLSKSWPATDWHDSKAYASYPTNDYLRDSLTTFKTKPAGKTYVAPGRKMGKTWIDRLQQSQKAKKR